MIKYENKTVYLCCGYTDMRKSINGLMELVKSSFKLNPFDDALFVFCNRTRDMIKILEWDGDGFWLHYKRLEKGHFRWTRSAQTPSVITLSDAELDVLLTGNRVALKLNRNNVFERNNVQKNTAKSL
jgi:transposase